MMTKVGIEMCCIHGCTFARIRCLELVRCSDIVGLLPEYICASD